MSYYPYSMATGARYSLYNPANGVTAVFNDTSDVNYVGMLTDVSGLDSPEIRESADDRVQEDGGVHGNFYYGRRPITMAGTVFNHATIAARDLRMDRARRASAALRSDATLTWRPSARQENWVLNPSIESNSPLNWATSGTVAATAFGQSQTWQSVGFSSLRLYHSALTVGNYVNASPYLWGGLGQRVNISPGVSYTASAAINVAAVSSGGSVKLFVDWFDAGSTYISSSVFNNYNSTGVKAALGNVVSPDNANTCVLSFQISAVGASGTAAYDAYIDNVCFAPTNSFPAAGYIDGSRPGAYWQGTPNASGSADYVEMGALVRRQQPFRETGGWARDFQISLVSASARMLGGAAKSATATATSATTTGNAVLENQGSDSRCPTVIRITGPVVNPVVTNTVTGKVLRLPAGATFTAGAYADIDILGHTSGANGNAYGTWNANLDYVNSTWPLAQSGTNTWVMTGTGMTVGSSSVTSTINDSWV